VVYRSFFSPGFGGTLEIRERVAILRDLGFSVLVVHGEPSRTELVTSEFGPHVTFRQDNALFDHGPSRLASATRTLRHARACRALTDFVHSTRPRALMVHGERPLKLYLSLQRDVNLFYFRHDAAAASYGSLTQQWKDPWLCRETAARKAILLMIRTLEARRFPAFQNFVANSDFIARIHGVPNAIVQPPPLISVGENSGCRQERNLKRIVFAGRIEHAKGAEQVLRIVRELPNEFSAVLFGDGDERSSLEQSVRSLGLSDRVHFAGRVQPAVVRSAMQRAGVTLIPSLVAEAMPLVAIESLACGTPVVGYDVGGIPELVQPPVGITVARGDSVAAARAIQAICENPTEWQKSSTAARDLAATRFSRANFVDSIRKMLDGAAGGP
jgi:glycosyltransferase involved in cell wall biosynthesis